MDIVENCGTSWWGVFHEHKGEASFAYPLPKCGANGQVAASLDRESEILVSIQERAFLLSAILEYWSDSAVEVARDSILYVGMDVERLNN